MKPALSTVVHDINVLHLVVFSCDSSDWEYISRRYSYLLAAGFDFQHLLDIHLAGIWNWRYVIM